MFSRRTGKRFQYGSVIAEIAQKVVVCDVVVVVHAALGGIICCEVFFDGGDNRRDGFSMKMTFLLSIIRRVAELYTVPHLSSFHCLEFKIFGVRLSVHEGLGTDDSKKSQVWLRTVCHFVRRLRADLGVRRPVAQKRRREHQFFLEKLWRPAVGKHALRHSCQSSSNALGHADLLRRVGAGVLERHPRLKAVALDILADELTSFVHPQILDAETTWNYHRLYEYLKEAESVVLGQNLRPLGVLVGNPCDVLVAPEGHWS